jgi:orotidine-5'-phosphate decarboxylase
MASVSPIVALDVPTAEDAVELVEYLGDTCRFYKVGNELFTAAGPGIVQELRARGCDVFLDLKFHDIPNTVAGGVRNAARLGARLVTVHAAGGAAMLQAAAAAARDTAGEACGVLAVTVLTSLTDQDVANSWGRRDAVDVRSEVLRLSDLALSAGVHGVVCSGREAGAVRERFNGGLSILVPGVRRSGAPTQDQARVVTVDEAVAAGARYVVVGRMVTAASDRRAAMREIQERLAARAQRA